jgi:hypothetical protein
MINRTPPLATSEPQSASVPLLLCTPVLPLLRLKADDCTKRADVLALPFPTGHIIKLLFCLLPLFFPLVDVVGQVAGPDMLGSPELGLHHHSEKERVSSCPFCRWTHEGFTR